MTDLMVNNKRQMFFIVLFAFGSVLIGTLIAMGGQLFSGVAAILVLSVYCVIFLYVRKTEDTYWLFLLAWFPLFLEPMILRITGFALFPIWQTIMSIVPVLGFFCFIKEIKQNLWLKCWLFFSLLFIFLACLSSVFGRTAGLPGAYQLVSDLKPMLLILLGFALREDLRIEKAIWFTVRWLWLPMVIFIAWEWLSPASYFSLLPGGPRGSDVSPISFIPTRAFGFFNHPAMMATYAVFMAFFSAGAVIRKEGSIRYGFLTLAYVAVVICTTQRQELSGLLISLCLLYIILSQKGHLFKRAALSFTVAMVLLGVFAVVNMENIQQEISMWGIEGNKTESPRSQLFLGAISVADHFFPLGSGLGTYGGAGSFKFDWSLYDYLGFGKYWWYGKKNYLMDTYWPNSIAEAGYIGAIILFFSYCCLFFLTLIFSRALLQRNSATYYFPETCVMLVYMLQLSISSPAFQDTRLFMIPAMLLGYSFMRHTKRRINE